MQATDVKSTICSPKAIYSEARNNEKCIINGMPNTSTFQVNW